MGVATSFESIRYSEEGRLALYFVGCCDDIQSHMNAEQLKLFLSLSFLVMKRSCSSLKVEFTRSAIFCNLNSFSLTLIDMVVKIIIFNTNGMPLRVFYCFPIINAFNRKTTFKNFISIAL